MITQLPLIVSLLLFISHAAEIEHKIELNRCATDTGCYVRRNCIQGNDDPTDANELYLYSAKPDEPLVDPNGCEVFVQIKAMSGKRYLFLMEINTATGDFTNTKEISITQDDGKYVTCEKDVDKPTSVNDKWSLEYKGLNSRVFETKRMFCSFMVTTTDATIEFVFDQAPLNGKNPTLEYMDGGQSIKLEYSPAGKDFWTPKNMNCGLDVVTSSDASFDNYAVKEADMSRYPIVCPGRKLIVKYAGKEIETDNIDCVQRKLKWSGPAAGAAKRGTPLEIGCLEKKYCASCAELPVAPDCAEGECTPATKVNENEGPDDCKMRKCDGGKWTEDGKKIIETSNENDEPQVTCKKDTSSGDSKWFMHVKGQNTPNQIVAASCLSVVHCPAPYLNCPEGKTCTVKPDVSKDEISCSDGKLGYDGDPVSEVKCNRTSGTWDKLADITKAVYCEKAGSETDTSPQTGGGGMSPGIIALIIVGVLFLIGGGVAFIVMKVVLPRRNKGKGGAGKGGTTSRKAGQKSSKKSSEKSKSKSGSGGKKSEGSDPPENKADGAKSTGEATPATPSTPAAVEGEKKGPPTTDIEGIKTDKDQAAPSDPNVPHTPAAPTPGAPTPGAPTPGVPPPVPPPAGAVPV